MNSTIMRVVNFNIMLCGLLLFAACSHGDIEITGSLDKDITIYPDYKEVTIPLNIAPLNFSIADSSDHRLVINGKGGQLQVCSEDGLFDIPEKRWKELLSENAGGELELTVAKEIDGAWRGYKPFKMFVANEPIDPFIAYRLLARSNDMWNRMGIYQRNLENYKQTAIYENNLTDYNCINCHTFASGDPKQMIFHMRGNNAGSVLIKGNEVKKLNTKTPETVSHFVYMYWHPNNRLLAATVCKTFQHFFINNPNLLEVMDHQADIVVYDTKSNTISTSPLLSSKEAWQSFPAFSPDGRSLYFCSTNAVDSIEKNFRQTNYSICRIDFDAEKMSFGDKVDTLFNGGINKKSASFPRISPNGKFLAFTLQEYGGFGVWHKDADLYMIRLSDGEIYPLNEINSEDGDSYHSWSQNSHWMVFSSRRLDGVYTQPFFTYIDNDGRAHKPFLLPQKNPVKYYKDLLWSYNIPEFIKEEAIVDKHAVMSTMKESKGVNVKVR